MDNELFQIPGEITKITTMHNKSLRLQVDTQENITSVQFEKLMAVYEALGWFTFSVRKDKGKIKPEDIIDLPPLDINQFDIKKSPCQRLRNVMFLYFTKKQHGKKNEFDAWYVKEMERKIDQYKERLE